MDEDEQLDQWLCLTQQGDQTAFDRIVEHLHRRLRLWLAARCEPAVDSDEIAHRAFIQAFRKVDSYQPGTCVRAWLWAIARNQLLAERTAVLRRRHREQELPAALCAELAREMDDNEAADETEIAALRRCVAGLDTNKRSLLAAYYRDGHDCPGLAAMVGSTAGAVRKRLCLLRRSLRGCVERRLAREVRHG